MQTGNTPLDESAWCKSGLECVEVHREQLLTQEAKDFTIRGFHTNDYYNRQPLLSESSPSSSKRQTELADVLL